MKTVMLNPKNVTHTWKLVDAEGKSLGRVATEVSRLLMGKHKPIFSPNIDTGDFVVVINASKIAITGTKSTDKMYFHHTGLIGGERWASYQQLMEKDPTLPLTKAVRGMIPHTNLGRAMMRKLKVYAGNEHPHGANKPEAVAL